MNLGKVHNQQRRVNNALVAKNVKPPDHVMLIKDHKANLEDGGKPTRPVCLAKDSPNGVLNNLLSDVADKIGDSLQLNSECVSTEDMGAQIGELNKRLIDEGMKDVEVGC